MSEFKTSPFRHNEAFALMWYGCKDCGHRERIWNSRDGVTPFGLACPSCGGHELLHVDWHLDAFASEHVLHTGQRFWRDGTVEDAVKIIERRIAAFAERGQAIPDNIAERLLADARNQTGEWLPGWPMIERVEEKSP